MPTRWQSLLFQAKALCFRGKRVMLNLKGGAPDKFAKNELVPQPLSTVEVRSPLYGSNSPAEFALQAGKVQNLRVAARALRGLLIPAGQVFSFWAHVPRPSRRRGFALGRELREGCVIPNIGGGLCQLSNALYDAALQAGFEIVERHCHSRRLPGSSAVAGRDATVFWNYVDLRFRVPTDTQIEVRLTGDELVLRFHALSAIHQFGLHEMQPHLETAWNDHPVESCEICGMTRCFRNPSAAALPSRGITAWLLDAFQPEFDAWVSKEIRKQDWQFIPLNSRRFRVGGYRWTTLGKVKQSPIVVLRRSLLSRRLAAQGAARQRALLQMDAELAESYARRLPPLADHLVISQNLLPFLWQRGDLGGRSFDVLMTRLPLGELQKTLDRAAAAHPESRTLGDFRAPRSFVEAEAEALAAARHWIMPHSAIARLAGPRAIKLPWQLPKVPPAKPGSWVIFPASTLGRKGAWELRELARETGLPIRLCGPVLETPDFWEGVRTERSSDNWLHGARAVVLPAWVEHQPRRLLQAVAAGVPVIASDACGLEAVPGVTTIPTGDVAALHDALFPSPRSDANVAGDKFHLAICDA